MGNKQPESLPSIDDNVRQHNEIKYDQRLSVIESVLDLMVNQTRSFQNLMKLEFRKLHKRLGQLVDIVARELSSEFPPKKDCLPLKTRENLLAFEEMDGEEYRHVVTYLDRFSIGPLTDTTRIVLKYAIVDSLSPSLTWHGAEPGTVALKETKFARALYAATARNKAYEKPQWDAFVEAMYGALKASKQRHANAQARLMAVGNEPGPALRGRTRRGLTPIVIADATILESKDH